jgi:hypothetical protein
MRSALRRIVVVIAVVVVVAIDIVAIGRVDGCQFDLAGSSKQLLQELRAFSSVGKCVCHSTARCANLQVRTGLGRAKRRAVRRADDRAGGAPLVNRVHQAVVHVFGHLRQMQNVLARALDGSGRRVLQNVRQLLGMQLQIELQVLENVAIHILGVPDGKDHQQQSGNVQNFLSHGAKITKHVALEQQASVVDELLKSSGVKLARLGRQPKLATQGRNHVLSRKNQVTNSTEPQHPNLTFDPANSFSSRASERAWLL